MENLFFANVNREDIIRIFGQIKKEEIPLWADLGRHHVMYESDIYPVLMVLAYLHREYHRGETLKRDFEKTEYDGFVWLLRELGFVNMQENFRYAEGQMVGEEILPPRKAGRRKTSLSFSDLSGFLSQSGLRLEASLLARFVASLLAKPFVILTGLSGSGKTRLACLFARWICENENQVCLVPVGADWTNRESLLGYPNALEQGRYVLPENGALSLLIEAGRPQNRHRPYFLILDEMNLSHVERYFADFLSVMESGGSIPLHPDGTEWEECGVPASVRFPDNLFVVGTVNVDETTYMFSPKVLDRASVIEFRITESEMASYLKHPGPLSPDAVRKGGAMLGAAFVHQARRLKETTQEEMPEVWLSFFRELRKVGAEFGYRTASEIGRFMAVGRAIRPEWQTDDLIDAAVMQKLLPRVHGARRRLEPVLRTLGALCLREGEDIETYLSGEIPGREEMTEKVRYPLSLEKILRMYRAVVENGFTGYTEA